MKNVTMVRFQLMVFHVNIALEELLSSMGQHVENVPRENIHLEREQDTVGSVLVGLYQTMVQRVSYALKEHIV